jgi:small-conductance mechanosensitive channel
MNKWILGLLILGFSDVEAARSTSQNELKKIEEEIQVLKNRLSQDQMKEMNQDVESQGLMIGDWDAYADAVQLIRQQEERNHQIQQQINKLEERKASLVQENFNLNK